MDLLPQERRPIVVGRGKAGRRKPSKEPNEQEGSGPSPHQIGDDRNHGKNLALSADRNKPE
jgi:hypothetical protein